MLGEDPEEEEDSSTAQSANLSDEVKAKLQEIIDLLSKDIGQLVLDAEPIRTCFKTLKGKLPESMEEALIPEAYMESHQFQVLKAEKRLADRLAQE